MKKIPNIADIIARHSNQDKALQKSAADLGAIILEMEHEEKYYGKHNQRMAKLKQLAELQKIVIHRMLDSSVDEHTPPKRPHLTIVK